MSILLIIDLSAISNAQDKTASTGFWDLPGTWSPSGIPGDDDVILIPYGSVVTVRGTEYTFNNAILIIEGELIMDNAGFNYSNLTFTGSESGIIIEDGGKVTDATTLGGDSHYISVQDTTFWSGNKCISNCGTVKGSYTSSGTTSGPSTLSNPLPVEMLYFTGNVSEKAVLLEWATATELNNSHFEIERSGANLNFHKIGKVTGTGNSNTQIKYSFKDHEIPLASNRLYYRIKQVDFDGQYEYSEIIAVYNETREPIELKSWPNPFDERFTVFLRASSPDDIEVKLYDMEGQEVFSQLYSINEGVNELEIDKLNDSSPGIYSLYLIGQSLTFKEKVIKCR